MSARKLSCLLLLVLAALLPAPSIASPLEHDFNFQVRAAQSIRLRGVTADACYTTTDCSGDRQCIQESSYNAPVPCDQGLDCRCLPRALRECGTSSECELREVCSELPNSIMPSADGSTFCLSAVIAGYTSATAASQPEKEAQSPAQGLTLFPCTKKSDCRGDRACVYRIPENGHYVPCAAGQPCHCFQSNPERCNETSKCEEGELCTEVSGAQLCIRAEVEAALRELTTLGIREEKPESDVAKPEPSGKPLASRPRRRAKRVTGEPCRKSKHCADDRICVLSEDPFALEPCEEREDCICAPPSGPDYCTAAVECAPRETCTKVPEREDLICVSSVLVAYSEDLKPVGVKNDENKSAAAGFTLYPCRKRKQCEGDRTCVADIGNLSQVCEEGKTCFCHPKKSKPCAESQECEGKELCARLEGGQICVSEDVESALSEVEVVDLSEDDDESEENEKEEDDDKIDASGAAQAEASGEDEGTEGNPSGENAATPSASSAPSSGGEECIDADALSHLAVSELAWEKHAWANVLCDDAGSCATAGHIVVFEGVGMKMDKYCEKRGCVEKRMLVNSPRYQRALRVPSKTRGLEYTAFAARYGSIVEEALLASAVRMGL